MVTYEEVTQLFQRAMENVGLATHPEHWTNNTTLEREYACTCHTGTCEEAENRSTVTISFTWSPLDTVLSLEGAAGVCDFFHEPDDLCPHLHTDQVPPLALELAYNLNITAVPLTDVNMQQLIRTLKLRASEHSSRAIETRPSVSLVLGDGGLQAEALTLQQRVEIPLWHPEGLAGLRDLQEDEMLNGHNALPGTRRRRRRDEDEENLPAEPHPEEWLPGLLADVASDVSRVLAALDAARPVSRPSDPADTPSEN
ncbi:MAG TPA: hypothetical protein VFU69_13895 [Ktedonobacterales bacterium]|nr:hypothetical protein [Ktedonobacterales bacterium]